MNNVNTRCLLLLAALPLSGCVATEPTHPVAALIVQPSAQNRMKLEDAIGNLLNSQPVKLADNTFTTTSTIIIEPKQPSDSRGNLLDGRETRQADTVSLLIYNGKCFLRHDQGGKLLLIKGIECKSE